MKVNKNQNSASRRLLPWAVRDYFYQAGVMACVKAVAIIYKKFKLVFVAQKNASSCRGYASLLFSKMLLELLNSLLIII